MSSFFLPSEKVSDTELHRQIGVVRENPLIPAIMNIVRGPLLVLNEQRQILALNQQFVKRFNTPNPQEALGVRPGDAMGCIYAHDPLHGCGGTEACPSCGAALAIAVSQQQLAPAERLCVLAAQRNHSREDSLFLIKSSPLTLNSMPLLILSMEEKTTHHKWAALGRVFFHGLDTIVAGLVGSSKLLSVMNTGALDDIAQQINRHSLRLAQEMALQECLFCPNRRTYHPTFRQVPIVEILQEVSIHFSHHAATITRLVCLPERPPKWSLDTDFHLLARILDSMITNALEATEEGGAVKVSIDSSDGSIIFSVWNRATIPPDIGRRIFQRHFTTKPEPGRGMGTYSMKLFGETFLGGKVGFTSSPQEGTVFRLTLPASPA